MVLESNMQAYRFIDAPQRSSFKEAIIVLSTLALLSLALALSNVPFTLKLGAVGSLFSLAIIGRFVYAVHIALLASLLLLPSPFFHLFQVWPFTILGPLVIYGAVVIVTPQLRHSIGWMRFGNIDTKAAKLIIATVFVSSLSLVGWVVLIKPDIQHHLALVPELPVWAYPFAGIGFALVNSAMEEIIFRGILMEATDSALGPGCWSVFIQAVPFAALHYLGGFPNGVLGFIMVLIYGVMLGAVRRISKGILAPVITHFAADMTIFSIIVFILFRYKDGLIS